MADSKSVLPFNIFFASSFLFPESTCSGRMNAAPEMCLSDISHDFCLSCLKHLDNLRESWPIIGVRIPAAGHDIR